MPRHMEKSREVRIREANPADAGPMARVHVDAWRTAYAGIVPAGHLDGLSYGERESRWKEILTKGQARHNLVAETGAGEVVGFAGGGPEREGTPDYRGELYAIYLLDEYQRKGVGRRLVEAVAHRLAADGIASMLVWVLKDNHSACRFYESLGAERIGRKTIAMGGVDLVEVFYGWSDITSLGAGGSRKHA